MPRRASPPAAFDHVELLPGGIGRRVCAHVRPSPGLRRIAPIRLVGPFDQREIVHFDGSLARYACVLETKPPALAECAPHTLTFRRVRTVYGDILPTFPSVAPLPDPPHLEKG